MQRYRSGQRGFANAALAGKEQVACGVAQKLQWLRLKLALNRFVRGYAASKYLRAVFNLGDFDIHTSVFGNPFDHCNRALALGTAYS